MSHLMLDFETLGTNPDTLACSLGVVLFNESQIIDKKEWFFNLEDQELQGRKATISTITWWMMQDADVRNSVFFPPPEIEKVSIAEFCKQFLKFIEGEKSLRVWSNGATFDIPIIENIFKTTNNMKIPWPFFAHRCYRTIKAGFGIEKTVKRKGPKHSALADAVYQTECLLKFFQTHPEWKD